MKVKQKVTMGFYDALDTVISAIFAKLTCRMPDCNVLQENGIAFLALSCYHMDQHWHFYPQALRVDYLNHFIPSLCRQLLQTNFLNSLKVGIVRNLLDTYMTY
jgi:hypothetical protein